MNVIRLHIILLLFFITEGSVLLAQERRDLFSFTDSSGIEREVQTTADWEAKRKQILFNMQQVMGKLPSENDLPIMQVRYTDSITERNYLRYTIHFTVAENEQVSAFLYIPRNKISTGKSPAILALHETDMIGKKSVDGQGRNINLGYAREMAERGYIVIAPDYPGFGENKDYNFSTGRYLSGTMKAIFDNLRCIDFLQSRTDVDREKIGVIGHSLGGHNAMFTAAFDTRLKAVVSSCGWTLFHDYFNGDATSAKKHGGKLWAWAQDRYMPLMREKYELDPDKVPFEMDDVIAAIAPRGFFSSSPVNDANFNPDGVKRGVTHAAEVYKFLNNPDRLKVIYPESNHDFPPTARWQAYQFIDKVLGFNPVSETSYSYLYNAQYFKRVESFASENTQKNIVILGNSLTERGQWNEILKRSDVANRGIGSDVTEGYIHRLKYVFTLKPKVCIVEGGVNDLGRKISQDIIISNLSVLIDTLRSEGIIPVLNTVTYLADNYTSHNPEEFNNRIKKLNRDIRALAKKKKVRLIDLNKKISSGSFLIRKYAIEDGIHYTAETYGIWGQEINKVLQNLMREK